MLTGLKHSARDEGPEELHVVVIDNGRTAMLANPHLRESLNCIRCGACLNACPVYQKIGGHAYGWIYPGPIGAVLTPQLTGRQQAADLPFASTLCGACRDVCPVKIPIPEMLLQLRHEIKEREQLDSPAGMREAGLSPDAVMLTDARSLHADDGRPDHQTTPVSFKQRAANQFEKLAFKLWARAMSKASRYERVGRLTRLAQKIYGRRANGSSALPFTPWTGRRDLPLLPPRTFREQWGELKKEEARRAGKP